MNRTASIFLSLLALSDIWWAASAWAQFIPHDLEPDRIRPQSKIPLPKIETVPDAVDYFLEPGNRERNPGKIYRMVHLRIPKAPYFNKNSSSGPARDYGLHLTMFYPNFSGLGDEENAECRGKARLATNYWGHCRRQMTVAIEYASKIQLENYYKMFQDSISRGYVKPVAQKSRYPGLELVGTNVTDSSSRSFGMRNTYYRPQNPTEDDFELLITCSESVTSPSCKTSFMAGKSQDIRIDVTFVLSLLPQWSEVIERTRDKVDSMIMTTYELPR